MVHKNICTTKQKKKEKRNSINILAHATAVIALLI